MLDKNSQNDTSNASKRIIRLYRKHIVPRIKQKVDVYRKYFHAEPLVCGTTEKYTPTRTPTPLPLEETRPRNRTSWEKAFTLSSAFILGCIPVQSWSRFNSASRHRSPSALLSPLLRICMQGVGSWACTLQTQSNNAFYTDKEMFVLIVNTMCVFPTFHAAIKQK